MTTNQQQQPNFKNIVSKLNELTPLELAGSWDNVGVLVEPSNASTSLVVDKVFLTNDLTESVLDEAIRAKSNMIISYHPPLFSSFKKITQSVTSQRIAIKAIEHQIPIYSPHSSLDAIKGGINDWISNALIKLVPTTTTGSTTTNKPIQPSQLSLNNKNSTVNIKIIFKNNYDINQVVQELKVLMMVTPTITTMNDENGVVEIITSDDKVAGVYKLIDRMKNSIQSWSVNSLLSKYASRDVGQGRIVTLGNEGVSIDQVIECAKKLFGLKFVRLGRPLNGKEKPIKSVALCAGSGGSVILSTPADLYLTGELSHHEILEACARGNYVIVCDHSNTERGYLQEYRNLLIQALSNDQATSKIEFIVSSLDRDPLEII